MQFGAFGYKVELVCFKAAFQGLQDKGIKIHYNMLWLSTCEICYLTEIRAVAEGKTLFAETLMLQASSPIIVIAGLSHIFSRIGTSVPATCTTG